MRVHMRQPKLSRGAKSGVLSLRPGCWVELGLVTFPRPGLGEIWSWAKLTRRWERKSHKNLVLYSILYKIIYKR